MVQQEGGFGDGVEHLRDEPVTGIERTDDAVVVHLAGELDLYNADIVREALLGSAAESPPRLVVDLAGVEFIDSTTLGVLVETKRALRDGRPLFLAAPGPAARRALELTGLERHFSVHESVAGALAAAV